jgi:hypothetical protein
MKPAHEQVAGVLRDVLASAPHATTLGSNDGATPIAYITIDRPAFQINKALDEHIGFPLFVSLFKKLGITPIYRGIDPANINNVLCNGVDRNPFYGTDSFEKALEYGGEYPLVLVLNGSRVENSFSTIYPDADGHAEKLAAARLEFSSDGAYDEVTGRWLFSRFPESDRGRFTDYEAAYGKYLTGEPQDALLALLRFESTPP